MNKSVKISVPFCFC